MKAKEERLRATKQGSDSCLESDTESEDSSEK